MSSQPAGDRSLLDELADRGWRIEDHAARRPEDGVWLLPDRDGAVSFPDEARVALAELEDRSIWFRSRNLMISSLLDRLAPGRTFVEIGSGNGAVAAHLTGEGVDVMAVEPAVAGASVAARRGVATVVAGFVEELGLPDGSLPRVGLFDVIEHLPDETPVLAEVRRTLVPGGTCIVTVPAFRWLWSQADETAGHHRRYRRADLDRLFTDAGFERRFSSYCFLTAIGPLFLLRALPYRRGRRLDAQAMEEQSVRELAGQGAALNQIGWRLAQLEAWWTRRRRLPFGTSVISVYTTPSS